MDRSTLGRIGALSLHATHDGREITANASARFLGWFEREVLATAEAAGETLSPAELARRAEYAKRAYFLKLSTRSARIRAARKRGGAA